MNKTIIQQKREFNDFNTNKNLKLLFLIITIALFSPIVLSATSIEMTTTDWINVFGNINMSYNEIRNVGNLSVIGNMSVGGNLSVDGNVLFVDAESDRVGIGTASPGEKLEVQGVVTSGSSSGGVDGDIRAYSSSGSSYINLYGGTYVETFGGPDMVFRTDATERMRIKWGSGNIGIGNTIPNNTLDVSGEVNISGSTSSGTALSVVQASSAGAVGLDVHVPTSISSRTIAQFRGQIDTYMEIQGDGNVGIGTTSPAEKLVVIGSVNISDSLNVSGTVEAARFIGDGNLLTNVEGDGTSPWNSSGANVYVNDSSAKVGVGTISPNEALTVVGNINATGNITSGSETVFIDGTNSRVGIGVVSPEVELEVEGGVNISSGLNVTNGNVLLATSGGNVGINTTDPQGALDVNGSIKHYGNDLLPSGVIVMWSGTVANIPDGWGLCNGSTYTAPDGREVATPDLRERFVQGVATDTDPGGTGGSTSKTTDGHTHTSPAHSHTISAGNLAGPGGAANTYATPTGETAVTINSNTDTISDIRPKYYEIAFIMKL